MGSNFSRAMDENFRKNQEFMIEMQRVQLERQIQMHNQMRERQMAMQIAHARELFFWYSSFYVLATVGLIARYRKTKNVNFLSPILPLSFVIAYKADMAYGSKLVRIHAEAENVMEYEAQLLHLPSGVPTAQTIDQARQRQYDEQRTRKPGTVKGLRPRTLPFLIRRREKEKDLVAELRKEVLSVHTLDNNEKPLEVKVRNPVSM